MHLGRSGKAYPHIQPSKRSVKRINVRLTELTTRNLTPIPLPIIVKRLNQSLRGCSCYFDYANNTKVFGDVKRHAEARLRTHNATPASQGESPKREWPTICVFQLACRKRTLNFYPCSKESLKNL